MREFLRLPALVAILWSLFQLFLVLTYLGLVYHPLHPMEQRPVHVAFALALTFLAFPAVKRMSGGGAVDHVLAGGAVATGLYMLWQFQRITTRTEFVDPVTHMDVIFGLGMVLLLLEATRRASGLALTIVALVFVAYGFLGPYLPGELAHNGIPLRRFVDLQYLSGQGIFGLPVGVSAEVVFYFILFGAFLEKSGGGRLFLDLAYFITGRTRGGSAKASVISSALFGTISGSAVANVVVDGIFTIPLMKKTGFSPAFAAAHEATASTGGQIMPPVMGAAAFIMAEILGIPYWNVAVAAAVPAVLYYISLYFTADLSAVKHGIKAVPREELPDVRAGLRARLHVLLPLFVLVYFLYAGYSLMVGAFACVLLTVAVSVLRAATRVGPRRALEALRAAGQDALGVAIPSAAAGLVIGVIVYTGLALKFTGLVIGLAGSSLLLALFLTMIACLILGMGMPTSAAYLMGAILLAPALQRLGLTPLAAHMFIFYFAVISMITPPVALAAYAAASIAGSNLWETGLRAFVLALAGFIIPYAFVYNTALLLQGPWAEVIWVSVSAGLGVWALAGAIVGYWRGGLRWWQRVALFAIALLLITPEKVSDLLGLLGLGGLLVYQWTRRPALVEEKAA